MNKELEKQFNIVFDENENVKACGRAATGYLIWLCKQIDNSRSYGNLITGQMNIQEVLALKHSLA